MTTATQTANAIMDEACLGEPYVSNGVDAALRKAIAQAIEALGECADAHRAPDELSPASGSSPFGSGSLSQAEIWTPDEVRRLHMHQMDDRCHPYTCPDRGDHPLHGGDRGILIPTVRGWICQFCDYTQNWAHGVGTRERDGSPQGRDGDLAGSVHDGPVCAANSPIDPPHSPEPPSPAITAPKEETAALSDPEAIERQ